MRGLLLAKESEVNSLIILGHSMVIIKYMLGKYFLVDRNISIVIAQAKKEARTIINISFFHVKQDLNVESDL
jgi:hypothetical protein